MTDRCPRCNRDLDNAHAEDLRIMGWTECEEFEPRPGNVPDFVYDRCFPAPGIRTPYRSLRVAYVQWCVDNGYRTCRPREFGMHLDHLGYYSIKGSRNVTCRAGISLL